MVAVDAIVIDDDVDAIVAYVVVDAVAVGFYLVVTVLVVDDVDCCC